MDRRLNLPVFGNSPAEYNASFFDDLSRKLNQLISAIRAPGEGRQTVLVLTDLGTSDYGLEPGTLFQVSGFVRISLPYLSVLSGVSSSGSVGSVTVTIV